MRVFSLHVYPIKSGGGLNPVSAKVELWGLLGDRRWMLVDGNGVFISAREEPRLFEALPDPRDDGSLLVRGPRLDPLRLVPPPSSTKPLPVRVHRDDLVGIPVSAEADAWFGKLLGRDDVQLVWMDDPSTRRPTDPQYSEPTDRVSFADGFPLLLTTNASLQQVNTWIAAGAEERGEAAGEPMSMQRFRPNLVVDGEMNAFVEEDWKRVRVGDVVFRVVKPCARCVMTTVHPTSLEKGKEPLRTLARHHKWNGKAAFGMNIIPDGEGTLKVGDPVEVLA